MVTRDVWIPQFWVCISYASAVLHLRSCPRTLRILLFDTYKTASRRLMVTSNSFLTEALWSGHGGNSVQGFKFHGCLQDREIADKRYDGPTGGYGWSPCVWKSVLSPAVLASVSVTTINRCVHRQMQCSETGSASQQCDCTRQWTGEQLNSAREVEMTDSADRCR